jgi:hypothetical protein
MKMVTVTSNRLFSKFTVSTTSQQHVRILEAHLEPPKQGMDGLTIIGCSAKRRGIIVNGL